MGRRLRRNPGTRAAGCRGKGPERTTRGGGGGGQALVEIGVGVETAQDQGRGDVLGSGDQERARLGRRSPEHLFGSWGREVGNYSN